MIRSKDRITAGDGARAHDMVGKSVISTSTNCSVFELLNKAGVLASSYWLHYRLLFHLLVFSGSCKRERHFVGRFSLKPEKYIEMLKLQSLASHRCQK